MAGITFILIVCFPFAACLPNRVPGQSIHQSVELVPLEAGFLLSNDFESGYEDPWYDSSPSVIHWVIEDYNSPTESYIPPTPLNGTKYLRATRDAGLSAGILILRTVMFTALPGDEISFNFWIHSKYSGGNTLDVVLSVAGVETTFLTLSKYSYPDNVDWRVAVSPIPVMQPTEATLIFYAYCGGHAEDAIAIDDIIVESKGDSTPTTTATSIPTTMFAPPTAPCIGDACPTTSSTQRTTLNSITTKIFIPPTAPCVGDACSTTPAIASDRAGTQTDFPAEDMILSES